MEDSFESRVEQAFGALGSSVCWRVSEQEVESKKRRNWERNYAREESCYGASYYEEFVRLGGREKRGSPWEGNFDDLGDAGDQNDNDDDNDNDAQRRDLPEEAEGEEEAWDVRMMVGLDSTLDFEDEEDVYDKVAVGREGAGERMYMKEINGREGRINTFNILPRSLKELKGCARDPRANHLAARERLEEDAREASCVRLQEMAAEEQTEKLDKKRTSEVLHASNYLKKSCSEETQACNFQIQPLVAKADYAILNEGTIRGFKPLPLEEKPTSRSELQHEGDAELSTSERNIEVAGTKKPVKRVRFAVDTPDTPEDGKGSHKSEAHLMEKRKGSECSSVVPDYVKNPSKYIHYTLDWSDEDDEKFNVKAFEACRQLLSQPCTTIEQESIELPQRVEFRPRPKSSTTLVSEGTCYPSGEGSVQIAHPVGIAAGYEFEENAENAMHLSSDVQAMDVEDGTVPTEKPTKGSRNYRSRTSVSFSDISD